MVRQRRRPVNPAVRIAAPLVMAVLVFVALLQYWPKAEPISTQDGTYTLRITVIDVGQGDSILLASGGQYALVDAGENDKGDDVVAYLKGIGVTKLAAAVGTHPHSDHIGGLDTVLDALPVGSLYLSSHTAGTETYEDVLDAAQREGLAVTVPKPGDTFRLGEAEMTFLWPPSGYDSDNVNDDSLVILVKAGGLSALLCADIEKDAEKALLEDGTLPDCDVLKVAHHGSDTSSTKAFLQAVSPETALISVGERNDYKHPDKDTLGRLANVGAKVYRTDIHGTISVIFNDAGISVSTDY